MWRQWSSSLIAERHKLLDRCLHYDPVLRDIHRLYQLLDGKSAALFTHVSIMIAACTFLAGSPTDGRVLEKIVFLLSTVSNLWIAIRLLKILDFNMYDLKINLPDPGTFFQERPTDMYDAHTDRVYGELRDFFSGAVKARGIAHKSALKWTRRLTFLVILFVLSDVVLKAWDYMPQPILVWLRAIALRVNVNVF